MVQLLQFGDIHLDGPLGGLSAELAARRRHELRQSFSRCLKEAAARKVDAVLIPGDLYEHDGYAPDTAPFLCAQLEAIAPIPVFIAPGNHDFHSPRALYAEHRWPGNVRIATLPRFEMFPVPEAPVAVHMFAHTSKENVDNLLAGYRVPEDERLHVLNFHGGLNEERFGSKRFCCPFSLDDLAGTGAHWASVGHYHGAVDLAADGRLLGAYGGWMESHSFRHVGPQSVLFVTLEKEKPPVVERFTSSSREYRILEVDAGGADNLEALVERIVAATGVDRPEGPHAGQLVRIVVRGQVGPAVPVDQLRAEQLAHHCFHLEIETDLLPNYDLDRLSQLPDTCGAFVRRMRSLVAEAPPEEQAALREALYYGLDALLSGEVRPRS
ncbi:metallophosphoesterase [bacterium]|nr:metallophosphoesterase [bacterium]